MLLFVLLMVSVSFRLEHVIAAYNDASSCTFYKPGVPACSGLGTSDVCDFVGYFLDGYEDYALIKHPYGIYFLVDVDNVWSPSTASDLFINGVYAYVTYVNGTYYVSPTVGCGPSYILTNNNRLVETTRSITNAELYAAIVQGDKVSSCNIPCNVMEFRKLIGPYPAQQNFVVGGNVLIHTTSLQSCVVISNDGSGYRTEKDAKKLASERKLNVVIKSDGKSNVIITQNRRPYAPPCVPASYNLFAHVKDFSPLTRDQPNRGCYLSTLVAQHLASPYSPNSALTYVEITIFKRKSRATIFLTGYLTTTLFEVLLDVVLTGC